MLTSDHPPGAPAVPSTRAPVTAQQLGAWMLGGQMLPWPSSRFLSGWLFLGGLAR